MWTSVDELHQIENLETVSRAIQKISLEYLARATKRNKENKSVVENRLLTWSQIIMYQSPLQNIL